MGGILNLQSYTGHYFGTVSGQGLLRLSGNAFPSGDFSSFTSSAGGTVEYYNSSDFQLQQLTYNNLKINLNTAGLIAYTMGNMIVNGNLNVIRGIFRISDNGSANADNRLIIDIKKDVTVEAAGQISVGTRSTNVAYLSTNLGFGGTAPYTTGTIPMLVGPPVLWFQGITIFTIKYILVVA